MHPWRTCLCNICALGALPPKEAQAQARRHSVFCHKYLEWKLSLKINGLARSLPCGAAVWGLRVGGVRTEWQEAGMGAERI